MDNLFFYLIENTKSRYSVLPTFLNGFEAACHRKGIRTKRIRLDTVSNDTAAKMVQEDKPDYTIGFNIVLDGSVFHVPHIAWVVDAATHYWELFDFAQTRSCFVDDDSRRLFAECGRPDALFLPHAVDPAFIERPFTGKREFEVVLPGSYMDSEKMQQAWNDYFPQEVTAALQEAAKRALTIQDMPIFLAFYRVLEENPSLKERVDEEFGFIALCNMLDVYVRGLDRIALIESLVNDFDVHIFTSSEDLSKWKNRFPSKITFHDECPADQLFDLFATSKFVLNSAPQIKRGLHERLLLALTAGANVISLDTTYLQNAFPKSSALHLYRYNEAGTLKESMKGATFGRDPELCRIIQKEHSWDARLETLLNHITNPPSTTKV